jgi:hypothetical protein
MNWYRQVIYWISIVSISYFAYTEVIYKKENILPDFETVSNELWIIILIFIFHTLNQIRISSDKTIQRKDNYLKSRLSHFKEKYDDLLNEKIKNDKLKSIAYAIMIYEDFNRPKVTRIIENVSFKLSGKKHSLGLMQVQTNEFINDKKSVELGFEKINKAYKKQLKKKGLDKKETIKILLPDAWHNEWSMERRIIADYNKDEPYVQEVRTLTEKIFELNTSENKSYLFPKYKGEKSRYNSDEDE